jgi:hypothetical protein
MTRRDNTASLCSVVRSGCRVNLLMSRRDISATVMSCRDNSSRDNGNK